jgi:hypothetical protein
MYLCNQRYEQAQQQRHDERMARMDELLAEQDKARFAKVEKLSQEQDAWHRKETNKRLARAADLVPYAAKKPRPKPKPKPAPEPKSTERRCYSGSSVALA